MMRVTFILVFVIVFQLQVFQALECELQNHAEEEGFQTAMKKCIPKQRTSEESEEDSVPSTRKERGASEEKQARNETKIDCALQCIFEALDMVNSEGYPDRGRVSQTLLKFANGREIRDFLQDSANECFDLMDKAEKMDTCEFSNRLTNCLAEKGSANCADWEITNLPNSN
ncbi:odorant-binding protein 59a [Photinus pyralis]|nr:odorant-binding protein 59a [Photinus pyralis]